MSTTISLFAPHLPVCKSQDLPKDTRSTTRQNPCPKSTLDTKFNRRKLLKTIGLSLISQAGTGALAARAEPESPVAATSNRLSYSRFLEYLNEGAVKKVDLFENGTVAIAEVSNPALEKIQRVKVQLPGLQQQLLRKLREKEVDFAAHSTKMDIAAAVLDLLANFTFPLIFLGALLLRSSSTNTPGGPNLPFGQIWNVRDRAMVVDRSSSTK